MKRAILVLALVYAIGTAVFASGTVDTASLLRDLYDFGTLPIITDAKCRQFSSYDRTGGNRDWGNFLSKSQDGTVTLAEMKGPGAIVRIWSANPDGILKVFLDGSATPVIAMPFKDFFTNPKFQPVRTQSSGGWISYYPIPYAKSCKVIVEKAPDFYYHVTYQTYGPGTKVKTYSRELGEAAQSELDAALKAWRSPAEFRPTSRPNALGPAKSGFQSQTSLSIEPGESGTLFTGKDAGCVDELIVTTDTTDPRALRQAIIRAYWDSEQTPSVEAPLIEFFGTGFQKSSYQAMPVGVTSDGAWYCRFPMPFAKSGRIEVYNGGKQPISIVANVIGRRLKSLQPNVGLFHAKWRRELTKSGEPHLILQAKGAGRFVGTSMTMQGYGGLGFLEGDELIYVDGGQQPSFNGTGTEDYFNSGWYFSQGVVSQPMHGATVKDDGFSRIAAYRFQISDHVDYQKELVVKIEHGGTSDYPGADYSSVAYFYSKEPHFEFFEMPKAEDIRMPKTPLSAFVPPATDTCCTVDPKKAKLETQDGEAGIVSWGAINQDMRNGDLVVFTPSGPAPALLVPFKVEIKDRYAVSAYMANGKGFGKVAAEIDSRPLPNSLDLYADQEPMPKSVELGDAVVEPGEHMLKLSPVESGGAWPKIGLHRISLTSKSPFIGSWYVIGPFDSPNDEGLGTAYPPETTAFDPKATYTGKDGKKIGWREISKPDVIYLNDMMTPNEHVVAYAITHVVSPDERKAELLLGSDDSVKVWLNGTEVWKNKTSRAAVPDNDRVVVTLNKGMNTLLLKIVQGEVRWGFVARFRDPNGELKYSGKKPAGSNE